jgi:protoporphyrinogen oxidase
MRIGIVGGGIAGLTAGHRLAVAGHEITLFEAQPELGGQAGTFAIAGTRLERFYHHLFHSDAAALELIQELGLGSRMVWNQDRAGYLYGGQVYDLATPLDLLRFRPLPLFSRLVLGLQTLWLQYRGDWRKLEKITAKEWVLGHGPRPIYDVVWGALLQSKFGDHADQVSMAWLLTKIQVRRESNRQFGETLGYLMGSFQLLIDALAFSIEGYGGQIHVSSPVERVLIENGRATGLRTRHGEGQDHEFDAVILTVGSPIVLQIAPDLPADLRALLAAQVYQGAQVMVLELERSLAPHYWLSVPEPEIPFVVALEHTNFIPAEHYEGRRIVYLGSYLPADHPRFGLSKEELLAVYTPYLQQLNPAFAPSWVAQSWLFRDPYGQPIITPNYSEKMPPHRTGIEGLYLANTTQIYPEDRGINYSVMLGNAIATIVQGGEARASNRW